MFDANTALNSSSSISVVIPVYNQVHLTQRCLQSLLEHTLSARELVLIDNASQDDTPKVLLEFKKKFEAAGWKVQIHTNLNNVGFGRAMNQGVTHSSGEYIALLNNDTWLMPAWDAALLDRCQSLQADMVGPYYDERPFVEAEMLERVRLFLEKNQGKSKRAWVSILMFFRRESFLKLKGFDEQFFLTCEDTDLRERMDQEKMSYYQVADCFIWHHSKGTRLRSELPRDYEIKALQQFISKWGFDPRVREHTWLARLGRRWGKIKSHYGLF